MDLQAAKAHDPRVSSLSRIAMVTCFGIASLMLLTSLSTARENSESFRQAPTPVASDH